MNRPTITAFPRRRHAFGLSLAVSMIAASFAFAQTQGQSSAAEPEPSETGEISGERTTPLLGMSRDRETVSVPVECAAGIRKDVELQPADASVTFAFDCLCGEDENALKQAMMRYRDDYMRVYRKEIALDDMGTANDYFDGAALPFKSGGSSGTELTLLLEPGDQQERTLYCYTAEDFKLIDDWARYIIFGN